MFLGFRLFFVKEVNKMKGTIILFSRKYRNGEGPSDKNVAAILKTELKVKVFETTFKTALGFKRVLNRVDELAEDESWAIPVLVVHYSDDSIFNGLVQKTITNRFFLFYDEKTKKGGLSHADKKGIGSKRLNKLYEFKTLGVSDLFYGGNPGNSHYATVYERTKYTSGVTSSCPFARPWRLLKVDDHSLYPIYTEVYKAVFLGPVERCLHYRAFREFKTVEVIGTETYEQLFRTAFKFRAHPFEIHKMWPILGTQFVIITNDIREPWPNDDVKIIYLGRQKPRSVQKLRAALLEIMSRAILIETPV